MLGGRSHVLWIETRTEHSSGSMNIPIESSVVALLLVVADVVALSLSSRWGAVPRELVRWVGGAYVVLVVLVVVMFAVLGGLVGVVETALSGGSPRRIPPLSRLSVMVLGVGLGALVGTSVVIWGPGDFASDVVLLAAAVWTWRAGPGLAPQGGVRRLLAVGLAVAAVTAAVVGVLLLHDR
jgi:hypothetical protein